MTIAERQALDERIYAHNSEVNARNASIREEDNKRKEQEAQDLADKRKQDAADSKLKSQDEISRRAADFQRQQIIQAQVAKGTNYIDAVRNGLQAVPLPSTKDTVEVFSALDKLGKPPERYGAATMNLGGETIYGQTNNAGLFRPISAPRPPKDGQVKLQVAANGNAEDYINSPIVASTNVLNTLPDDLRTNQFNSASMASIAPRPTSTISPPDNAPAVVPYNTPTFRQGFLNAAQQASLPAPVDQSNSLPPAPVAAAPAVTSRQFKDGSGTVWTYVGSAADPTTDKNPSSWQPSQ